MLLKEKALNFLKPTNAKIIVGAFTLFYLGFILFDSSWGHFASPLPNIITLPVSFGILSVLLIFPYAYLLSCLIVFLYELLKSRKAILVLVIVLIAILFGIDEPIMNNTLNRPDYSVPVNEDCIVTSTSKGWCGNPQCINANWDYYDSMINSVFALSCGYAPVYCSCQENRCTSYDTSKFHDFDKLEDCNSVEEYVQEQCRKSVQWKLDRLAQKQTPLFN